MRPILHSVLRSKALRLAILFTVAGALLSWRYLFGSRDEAVLFQIFLGYWWMWGVLGVLVWSTVKLWRHFGLTWNSFRRAAAEHRWAIVSIAGCSVFLHLHEPHEFKVLYDEPSHLLTSQVMHVEKQPLVAARTHFLGDNFILLNNYPSFRQYFYPFLLSLSHDVFGYSAAAPFVLNGVAGVLLLGAVYALGYMLGGRFAGITGVLLLTSLPLLAQNVTCAGYDVLNLALLTLVCIAGLQFLRASSADAPVWLSWLGALTLAASQVRYESIVYFGLIGILVVMRALASRELIVPWAAVLWVVLCIPSFTSNMIFMKTESFLLPSLRRPGEPFMSLQYLVEHSGDLLAYLFYPSSQSTSSVVAAIMGTIGLAALIARLTRISELSTNRHLIAFGVFTAVVGAAYTAALCNFWGSPLDGLAARFSLPLWLCLACAGGWVVAEIVARWKLHTPVICGLVLTLVLATARANSAHYTTNLMVPSRVERWFLQFADKQERETTLFVSKSNVQLMAHRYAAISMDALIARAELCVRVLQLGIYKNIYILERSEFPAAQGEKFRKDYAILPPHILVEEIDRRTFAPGQVTKIYRFLGYMKDGKKITPETAPPLPAEFESEAKRNAYILSAFP
jgi:hypothetical protein